VRLTKKGGQGNLKINKAGQEKKYKDELSRVQGKGKIKRQLRPGFIKSKVEYFKASIKDTKNLKKNCLRLLHGTAYSTGKPPENGGGKMWLKGLCEKNADPHLLAVMRKSWRPLVKTKNPSDAFALSPTQTCQLLDEDFLDEKCMREMRGGGA